MGTNRMAFPLSTGTEVEDRGLSRRELFSVILLASRAFPTYTNREIAVNESIALADELIKQLDETK